MNDEEEKLDEDWSDARSFRFGDSATLSADLITRVRAGRKRATCDALATYEAQPGAMPVVGRADVAQNWDGTPALVIRTTHVQQIRFCDVTEDMALAEGENDDLAGWQRDHRAYFERNGGFDPEMMLVFEYFEVVEDLAGRE